MDVGIQEPRPGARLGQCNREVYGGGGFSHASLAGSNGNDIPNAGNSLHVGAFLRPHIGCHVDLHVRNAIHSGHQIGGLAAEFLLDWTSGGGQLNGEGNMAGLNRNILHKPQRNNILVKVRVDNLSQDFKNLFFCHYGHGMLLLISLLQCS